MGWGLNAGMPNLPDSLVALCAVGGLALGGAALAVSLLGDGGGGDVERRVVINETARDDAGDKWARAECPKGYRVVSGGALVPHGSDTRGVAIYWSVPFGNAWEVSAQDEQRGTFPWQLQVYAVCLKGVKDDSSLEGVAPRTVGG